MQHAESRERVSAQTCGRMRPAEFARRTSLVWMMFVVTAVYHVTWLPFILYQVRFISNDYRYRLLYLLNNATNFIVYGAMSPCLRADMWRMLTCGRCKGRELPRKPSFPSSSAISDSSKSNRSVAYLTAKPVQCVM